MKTPRLQQAVLTSLLRAIYFQNHKLVFTSTSKHLNKLKESGYVKESNGVAKITSVGKRALIEMQEHVNVIH